MRVLTLLLFMLTAVTPTGAAGILIGDFCIDGATTQADSHQTIYITDGKWTRMVLKPRTRLALKIRALACPGREIQTCDAELSCQLKSDRWNLDGATIAERLSARVPRPRAGGADFPAALTNPGAFIADPLTGAVTRSARGRTRHHRRDRRARRLASSQPHAGYLAGLAGSVMNKPRRRKCQYRSAYFPR
ncbi:MAG: hypothetical protein EOS17_13895 [Mesorhizobium sp.]|nr:MAG: hypothetical protein EOS17_13895 [Mesorhizobium sp.]